MDSKWFLDEYFSVNLTLYEQGGNNFIIETITRKENGFVSWEQAFYCLKCEDLPARLRAQYCSLLTHLFVTTGRKHSVLDLMSLSFLYKTAGNEQDHPEDYAMIHEESQGSSLWFDLGKLIEFTLIYSLFVFIVQALITSYRLSFVF